MDTLDGKFIRKLKSVVVSIKKEADGRTCDSCKHLMGRICMYHEGVEMLRVGAVACKQHID